MWGDGIVLLVNIDRLLKVGFFNVMPIGMQRLVLWIICTKYNNKRFPFAINSFESVIENDDVYLMI